VVGKLGFGFEAQAVMDTAAAAIRARGRTRLLLKLMTVTGMCLLVFTVRTEARGQSLSGGVPAQP
jgi:hypothetical protein